MPKNFREKLSALYNPLSRRGYYTLQQKQFKLYFFLTFLVSLVGYALLVIFPLLTLWLPTRFYSAVITAETLNHWLDAIILFSAFLLSAALSWSIINFRFTPPKGVVLQLDKYIMFDRMLSDLRSHIPVKFDRIVLDDSYGVRMVKTPRVYFPLFCSRTLVIGIQTLLSTTPNYCRVQIARSLGQARAKGNKVNAWFYYQQGIWEQYHEQLLSRSLITQKILGYIFKLYSRFYNAWIPGLSQKFELEGDRCVRDFMHVDEVNEALVYDAMVRDFLETRYWPEMEQLSLNNTSRSQFNPNHLPYRKMMLAVLDGLNRMEMRAFREQLVRPESDWHSSWPSFRERMLDMGQHEAERPKLPESADFAAATIYLSQGINMLVQVMDSLWVKQHLARQQSQAETAGKKTGKKSKKKKTAPESAREIPAEPAAVENPEPSPTEPQVVKGIPEKY